MVRALTHIHTGHSWDSRLAVGRVADALVGAGVELALVCDHNDFTGSLLLRQLIEERGLGLRAPVAAEIRTDHGDVIVVFEDGEPPEVPALTSWAALPGIVRARGGLIWLPHPFQSHTDVEALAAEVDVIEVFNARCSPEQNARAADLCARHGAVPAYGADVHRRCEIGRFVAEYEPAVTVLDTLRSGPTCSAPLRTRKSDIMAAEVVHALKRRRPTRIGWFGVKWAKHRAKELAGLAPDRRG